MSVAARYATPLTAGRANYGPAVDKIGAALGVPPMPWVRHLNRLSTELLASGEWAYTTIVVTTPRQAGKTTARGPLVIHRCLIRPMARCWLTAQTRQDARDILVDEVGPRWNARTNPLRQLAKLRRSQGSEGLMFRSGAFWRVFAPGEDDLHGKANEIVDVDESWKFTADQGAALEQAIDPTFSTTDGQFTMFSTRGTARSVWLDKYVALGRQAVAADHREGIALVEHSLPDDVAAQVLEGLHTEKDSPAWAAAVELVIAHHPANGYTLRPRVLRAAARKMPPEEFLRAYGNVPTRTTTAVFTPTAWTTSRLTPWPTPSRPLALAIEVGPGRADAAIIAAWILQGKVHVDVVDYRPGADWMPGRYAELVDRYHPEITGHAGAGPVVETADRITRAGHTLTSLKLGDYAAACAGIVADVEDDALRHPGERTLTEHVTNVAVKPIGDGAFVFARLRSEGSITTIVGAAVARWLVLHAPTPVVTPAFTALSDTPRQ